MKEEELLNYPYDGVKRHPHMSNAKRAAQFAPFAALTGYEEAIEESGRITEERKEMHEDALRIIQAKTAVLCEHIKEQPYVSFTVFREDEKRNGGTYRTEEGNLKTVDEVNRLFVFTDRRRVNMDDVSAIDSPLFEGYDF